jgi:IS5 family transposase
LRQSYSRVAKHAAIMVGRYTHAHQFKRARRALKFLRTRLSRIIRDINRKKVTPRSKSALHRCFLLPSECAIKISASPERRSIRSMRRRSSASEEGKARAAYEFGCKVSIITP